MSLIRLLGMTRQPWRVLYPGRHRVSPQAVFQSPLEILVMWLEVPLVVLRFITILDVGLSIRA